MCIQCHAITSFHCSSQRQVMGVTGFPINGMGNSLFTFLTTLSFISKTEASGRLIALLEFFKVPVEKVKNSS